MLQGDARVVEHKVETAKMFDRFGDHVHDVRFIGDICFYEESPASSFFDERNGLSPFCFASACNDHIGALLCKGNGGGATNTGGATGHQDNFSCECFHRGQWIRAK